MAESTTIEDLVNATNLEAISFLEVAAKRADGEVRHGEVATEEYQVEPEFTLEVGRGVSGSSFRIRIRTDIDTEPGTATVDAAAEYSLDGLALEAVSEELMLDFVNKVAAMALIPYLRQGLADMTQRVFGTPLLMPMYRRGDLSFGGQADKPV